LASLPENRAAPASMARLSFRVVAAPYREAACAIAARPSGVSVASTTEKVANVSENFRAIVAWPLAALADQARPQEQAQAPVPAALLGGGLR
jgi:hypothetical protein